MLGGVLFNVHTLYDTYAHDLEPDVNDVLPSFLIGAYVQRRSNPAKFDLNPKQMNRIRQNLNILGQSPEQFSTIPTFDYVESRFDNPFMDAKFKPVLEKLEELEIITDVNEISTAELPPDVVTAAVERNPVFDRMYPYMEGLKTWRKPPDNIPAEDAKTIADLILKVDGRFESTEGSKQALEQTFVKTQKNFEESFRDLIELVQDAENVLGITQEVLPDGTRMLRVPEKILISEEVKKRARDGEIEWLVDANKVKLEGEEAMDALFDKTDGFNAALKTVEMLNYAETNPIRPKRTIESESLLKQIYEIIYTEYMENMTNDKR